MRELIEFKNVVKDFGGTLVLKGINLTIHENEFVTLLGPSGCGKTTLFPTCRPTNAKSTRCSNVMRFFRT
jgi:ABC-type Fe3+/spermidine/putrescine transport system ATPase subunit